ncbi:hypothetical protein K2173_007354 [Erythroxylum novogranatense]|uniref:RING-type domain-containing protein n=1 Tax=Erythroxylum novogranatense TaxID=1862640 RepID=A0AAV8T7J8_9ROSI|nr:hypothetical protein K2173_007354 [Erythroxylum novogranatense]
MGSACCKVAKDKDFIIRSESNTLNRNARCSPSWSFRWENRRRVAGEVEDASYQTSHQNSRYLSAEIKELVGSDQDNHFDEGSLHDSFGTPFSVKSPVHQGTSLNLTNQSSDVSLRSNNTVEVKSLAESLDATELSSSKLSYTIHSPFLTPVADSTHGHLLHPYTTPSRWPRRSPGHRLFRQISDSRILGLKSPNNYSLSEGRSSLGPSLGSHNLVMGSRGGSSDCWSMQTFSELVASSQRERWSFDSERFSFGLGKIGGGSSRFSCSPSPDLRNCAACSKSLNEKSWWQNPVVSVLVCGHAYHAECLEMMTPEIDKYDPSCPMCTGGEKQVLKMSKRALRTEADLKAKFHKISRNRVVDSSIDSDSDDFYPEKNITRDGGSPKLESSSSAGRSSVKPFLRKHFSFGSRWSRSFAEKGTSRKRGFWARHHKD